MKHFTRFFLTVLVTACTGLPALAQDFVYLFPSKEIAETGEDLFFKAYLMDRQTLALSERSRTLFLEIRSERDSLVWSEMYPLIGGRGDGHISIGNNWPQGEYFLEGYAKSSFTTDSTEALHPRRIRVVERVNQMEKIAEAALRKDSLLRRTSRHRFDLFPEGGDLVDGVTSTVAFKATYGNGFPEEVTGKVLEDGQEIAGIFCIHDGMGRFVVTPRLGKTYQVVLDDGRAIPFPEIKREGLSLRLVRNNAAGIDLVVSAPDNEPHAFSIIAKLHGIPCGGAEGTVQGKQTVRLPKELVPFQGIVELTLTDGDGRPVAERLVYVHPEQRLNVTATPDKERYNLRDTGKVRVQVTDAAGNPVLAELAVSIADKAYLYLPGHENILSHSYLSEQIRGNIFNPAYYFDEGNVDRLLSLDLLLMTQGWRRYVGEDRDPGRQILTDGISGRDLKHDLQYIQAISPQGDTCLVMTDSLGRFEIDPELMAYMRGNVYLKPMVTKPKPKLVIDNPFETLDGIRSEKSRYLPQNQIFEPSREEPVFYFDPETTLLAEATVKARRRGVARDKVTGTLDSLAILASPEWVCDHGRGSVKYLNDWHGYSHHSHPQWPANEVEHHKPKRGEVYRVIKYIPWPNHPDGLWMVDMTDPPHDIVYEGPQYTEEELLEMYGMSKAQGYYPRCEFYEPDALDLADPAPDYRNLIQWKPSVLTDENGVAEIPFSTSDVNTEFIGLVEAVDGTGLLGARTFTFRVLK